MNVVNGLIGLSMLICVISFFHLGCSIFTTVISPLLWLLIFVLSCHFKTVQGGLLLRTEKVGSKSMCIQGVVGAGRRESSLAI